MTDPRIIEYRTALEKIARGELTGLSLPLLPDDELRCLGEAILSLAGSLEKARRFNDRLNQISDSISAGLTLDEVMERVYISFRELIPYRRIGLSLIDPVHHTVRARWSHSDFPEMKISGGYEASLKGSSLEQIISSGKPRILNDLERYLRQKPDSESTRLIIEEGVRASLTCPLIVDGKPIGFIFFSNDRAGTYQEEHIEVFQQLAQRLSIIVEKSALVTELARQKEAIERQNEQLKSLSDLKNTFLGIAAHDLRNPISNLRMGMDLLSDRVSWPTDESRQEFLDSYLETIDRQTRHMMTLLNDLLDITQIESGKLVIKLETIDVAHYLDEIARPHVQAAQAKNISVCLEPDSSGKAIGDPVRVRQVLDNLISNAIKYSPPGSKVWVWAVEHDNHWRFNVRDQGPGVTEADLQRLFTDFGRGSALPTGGEKSTGLGLAISRRVVEAHNGKIGVDQAEGAGAVFWFTLPC